MRFFFCGNTKLENYSICQFYERLIRGGDLNLRHLPDLRAQKVSGRKVSFYGKVFPRMPERSEISGPQFPAGWNWKIFLEIGFQDSGTACVSNRVKVLGQRPGSGDWLGVRYQLCFIQFSLTLCWVESFVGTSLPPIRWHSGFLDLLENFCKRLPVSNSLLFVKLYS